MGAGSWAGSWSGSPDAWRRPGGGEAPRGPTSPALPVPKARLSSLFIQVPELRLHGPQGQRHAAQCHRLHPRALQHHVQPGEQPRPGALGPPTSRHAPARWARPPHPPGPFLFPCQPPGVLQGFELVDAPGECCKKCQQTHCIITRPGQQSLVLKVRPRPRPQGRERPASRQDTCLGFWALWVASPSQATAVGHGPSGDCGPRVPGPLLCHWLCSSGPMGCTWQGGQGAAWRAPTWPHTELPRPRPAAQRHEE